MIPKSMRPLLPYLKRYRWGFVAGIFCILLSNGAWVLLPQVIRHAVDDLNTEVTPAKLLHFALQMLELAAVRGIFLFLTRWVVIGISRDIEFDLRNDLFAHLETLSYSYYQRMRTGDIMARVTNDLNAVRKLTMYAFLPLPVVSVVIQYFGRRIHERFERIQAMFSDISARAQENFSGARVIRAYVQEDAEIATFEAANQEYVARSLKLVRLMGMLWPTLEFMLGLALVLVLWIGGREVLAGRMQIGAFTAFNIYMMQLTFPIIA